MTRGGVLLAHNVINKRDEMPDFPADDTHAPRRADVDRLGRLRGHLRHGQAPVGISRMPGAGRAANHRPSARFGCRATYASRQAGPNSAAASAGTSAQALPPNPAPKLDAANAPAAARGLHEVVGLGDLVAEQAVGVRLRLPPIARPSGRRRLPQMPRPPQARVRLLERSDRADARRSPLEKSGSACARSRVPQTGSASASLANATASDRAAGLRGAVPHVARCARAARAARL